MTKQSIKEKLNQIHASLLKVHRALLQIQVHEYQKNKEQKLNFQEIIELASGHEDFAWLKDLSNLILKIDDYTLDKNLELTDEHLETVKSELNSILFHTEDSKLQTLVSEYMDRLPSLKQEIQNLKGLL